MRSRERLPQRRDRAVERDLAHVAAPPVLELEDAAIESFLPDDDAERDADQIAVLELDARALVAIVDQTLDAGGAELGVEPLGGVADRLVLHRDRDDDDLEGRERQRPD